MYASVSRASIASDDGLSPVRCQSITWTNADVLLTGRPQTKFSDIQTKIQNVYSWKTVSKWWLQNGGQGNMSVNSVDT